MKVLKTILKGFCWAVLVATIMLANNPIIQTYISNLIIELLG